MDETDMNWTRTITTIVAAAAVAIIMSECRMGRYGRNNNKG